MNKRVTGINSQEMDKKKKSLGKGECLFKLNDPLFLAGVDLVFLPLDPRIDPRWRGVLDQFFVSVVLFL